MKLAMKTDVAVMTSFAIIGLFSAALAIFLFRPVLALVDASSSATDVSTSSAITATSSPTDVLTSPEITGTSSPDSTVASTTTTASPQSAIPQPPSPPPQPPESSPQSLTEVHITGKKYIDYFTDGKSVTIVPGDPKVDANLDQPDAQIPTHDGLTWDHTSTQFLYDTSSGDLEVGDYAQMPSGGYIAHYPATVYTDATSSVPQPDRITTSPSIPTWDHLAPSSNNNGATSMPQNTAPQPSAGESSSTTDAVNDSPASSSPPASPTDSSITVDTASSSTSL
jgi:hypothetical protein